MIHCADRVDLHADALEDVPADRDQSIGVAGLRRALERAVEEDRPQVAVVSGVRGDLVVDEGLNVVWEHAQYVSVSLGSMPEHRLHGPAVSPQADA